MITTAPAVSTLRTAMVTPRFAPFVGGVEVHVGAIASALARRNAAVTILTQDVRAGRWQDGDLDVHAFRDVLRSSAYPVAPALARWLHRNAGEIDVVHAHSYHAVPALAAARAASGAFVFTPHYHGTGHTTAARAMHRVYGPLGRRIFDRADRIICVSNAEAALVERDHPRVASRIDVVPNGVDVEGIERAAPFERGAPIVLVLGRLVGYKRVEDVVRAMVPLAGRAELVVVGDGPDLDRIQALAAACGAPVRLLGRVPTTDVHRWLRTADVLVSASRHEAFGLTVLEALTAGARVVASDIPAHCEVAARWDTVRAVTLFRDTHELTDAIRGQLDAGRTESATRPRWSWDDVASCTLDVYGHAIGSAPC